LGGSGVSGDAYLVRPGPESDLIAVIDGLGHGPQAAAAADAAVACLTGAESLSVVALMTACHNELRKTRGVSMSLVQLRRGQPLRLSWLTVGNISGAIVTHDAQGTARRRVPMRGGIVGLSLPPLHPLEVELPARATLLMATDGVGEAGLDLDVPPPGRIGPSSHLGELQRLADEILAAAARGKDDALVVAARVIEGAP
jgi:hypothetical protein